MGGSFAAIVFNTPEKHIAAGVVHRYLAIGGVMLAGASFSLFCRHFSGTPKGGVASGGFVTMKAVKR